MGRPTRFAPEVRERAVRMVEEQAKEHPSQWAASAGPPGRCHNGWQAQACPRCDPGKHTMIGIVRGGFLIAVTAGGIAGGWTAPAPRQAGTAATVTFTDVDGNQYEARRLGRHYWGATGNRQEPYAVYMYNTGANVLSDSSPDDKTSGIAFSVRYVRD